MESWGNPVLTGYFCGDFPSRTTPSRLLRRKDDKIPDLKLHKIRVCEEDQHVAPCQKPWIYRVPHLTMPPGQLNALAIISYNCQKVCSWSRRPETIMEIRKEATFLEVIIKPIIYRLFKDFTYHRKKTNRALVFSQRTLTNNLKYMDQRWDLPTIRKTRSLQTHWRVQVLCMKVQAHTFSEPLLGYNQDQMPFTNQT